MVIFQQVSIRFWKEVYVTCLAYMSYIMVGVCRGYTAFLLPQLKLPASSIKMNTDEESWFATLSILPCPIGCLLCGVLMDWIGRKKTLTSIFIPFIIGWMLVMLAVNTTMLYIGAFFNAIASGMAFCTVSYLGEMISSKNRGFLVTFMQPLLTFGGVVCNIMVYWLKWKLAAVCFFVISILCFFVTYLLPESPLYLIGHNEEAGARKVFDWMGYTKSEVDNQIAELTDYCQKMRSTQKRTIADTAWDMLHSWKPFLVLFGLSVNQLLSGFLLIVTYTIIFFEELNLPFDSQIASIIYSGVCFISSIAAPAAAHSYGRKPVFAVSALGMGAGMSITAAYETIFVHSEEKPYFWVAIVGVYMYDISLAVGMMIIPFIMTGELFRSEVRGVMCGLMGGLYYLMTGATIKLLPYYMSAVGIVGVTWTFALFSFNCVLYATIVLPETRGKTLHEIQLKYFNRKSNGVIEERTNNKEYLDR